MVPDRPLSSGPNDALSEGAVPVVLLVKDILPHLATAARALAIKGFSPDEATSDNGACGLTVHGRSTGIEGRIEFKLGIPGSRETGWGYAITSTEVPDKSENGFVADEHQVKQVVEAFVSVFTTVASFAAA